MSIKQTNSCDISIILPIYNIKEEYLCPCLDSIANQTKDKLEVIMVDDGSTDNSGEVADRYAQKYDNFVCYHIENNGVGHARNFGVAKARGKYIYFVDPDDIIASDILERLYLAAERNNSDMAICNADRFNSSNEWPSRLHDFAFKNLEAITHITLSPALLYDTAVWNKLIKRDFWERNHIEFPENVLYEDIPVAIKLHYLANKVCVIRKTGYKWRYRDTGGKSITQRVRDLTNFYDRIKVLKMLDAFFEKNVKEEKLISAMQARILKYDMFLFVDSALESEKEKAQKVFEGIREYVLETMPQEMLDSLNLIDRKVYQAIFDGDYERIIKLASFRKHEMKKCPCFEKENRLFVKLPCGLIEEDCCDITMDMQQRIPTVTVNGINSDGSKINLKSTICFPKINIRDESEQEIKAFLVNEFTGRETALDIVPYKNTEITKSPGSSVNKLTQECYNYDGTGFIVTVDAKELFSNGMEGSALIAVRYKNRFTQGTVALNNLGNYVENKADGVFCVCESGILKAVESEGRVINILAESFEDKLNKVCVEKNALYLKTENSKPLIAINGMNNTRVQASVSGSEAFSFSADELCADSEYNVFFSNDNGELLPLYRTNKAVNLYSNAHGVFVVRSNKTNTVSIRAMKEATFLSMAERNGDILTLNTESAGAFDYDAYKTARLVVDDELLHKTVVLAKSVCTVKKGRVCSSFQIDFSAEKLHKNFYRSTRDIFVEYENESGNLVRHRIFSKKHVKEYFEYATLGITVSRCLQAWLQLKLTLLWSGEEATDDKRKALVAEKYPRFREEPINKKLIIFESDWGHHYNCSPRAIYEYIDKNYPQYECVWSFFDPRTPVNGKAKRVRKGSQEYYRVLATAKYFISNENFEYGYVKREGQIEIQTMPGTPLKTVGLDVESEMKDPPAIERCLRRASRWDYLIVQGRFVEDMAYQMFHFEKNILKTGYPRTDALYRKADIKAIKQRLGIPLDKKVILYMPTWRVKKSFEMALDLEQMKNELSKDYVLLVRIHYYAEGVYDFAADNEFAFDLTNYSYVEDLYHISDLLITDYSSAMFDYALLKKPMIFYAYDFETYTNEIRKVYSDLRQEAPGPIAYSTQEVISALENIENEQEKYKEKYNSFYDKYLTYECPDSAKKVVKEVIKPSEIETFIYKAKRKIRKRLKRK